MHHPRCATNSAGRSRDPATPGWMVIGRRMAVAMYGKQGAGTVRPVKELTGIILTTITTAKAGKSMKATGIMRIATGPTVGIMKMTTTIIENDAGPR